METKMKEPWENNKCPICGAELVPLNVIGRTGITGSGHIVGGKELYGCTGCHCVFWKPVG